MSPEQSANSWVLFVGRAARLPAGGAPHPAPPPRPGRPDARSPPPLTALRSRTPSCASCSKDTNLVVSSPRLFSCRLLSAAGGCEDGAPGGGGGGWAWVCGVGWAELVGSAAAIAAARREPLCRRADEELGLRSRPSAPSRPPAARSREARARTTESARTQASGRRREGGPEFKWQEVTPPALLGNALSAEGRGLGPSSGSVESLHTYIRCKC